MNDIPNRILIVGLGLMGGSIADALSSKGYRVEALDRNPDEIDYAMKQGWIIHGETEVREEYISSFSFIVFALYPSILVSWMKEHVGKEVIVPYLKRTFFDAVQEALYMLLYKGQTYVKKGPNAFGSNITYGGTQYNGYFASSSLNQPPKRASEEAKEQTLNVKKGPSDLLFPSRADAEDTLIKMDEIISTYGSVSFADLEEMAGVTGDFTDNKYGWKDIRNAKVLRNALAGGYYIRMPRMIVLD